MIKLDSKNETWDPQKDFDNFTLNLSEAKMKIAYPQKENSVPGSLWEYAVAVLWL